MSSTTMVLDKHDDSIHEVRELRKAAAQMLSRAAWKSIRATMTPAEISEQRRAAGKLGAAVRWGARPVVESAKP